MIVKKTLVDPAVAQALVNYLTERPYKEVAELVTHLANSPTTDVTFPDPEEPKAEAEKKPLASAAKRNGSKSKIDEPKADDPSEESK